MSTLKNIFRAPYYYIKDKYWQYRVHMPKETMIKQQWYAYHVIKNKYIHKSYNLDNIRVLDERTCRNIIWMYWNTGEETSPKLVRKCIEAAIKFAPAGYEVRVLSEKQISKYVTIPNYIYQKRKSGYIPEALFSDLLRSSLLYCYGGIWMDATCLLTDDIPSKILNAEVFFFQESIMFNNIAPTKMSNWFIKANEGSYLLQRLLQVMFAYWKEQSKPINYFIYHLALSALKETDEIINRNFLDMPYICNMNPHLMQLSFDLPYTDMRWRNIIETSTIHKLTYKVSKETECDDDNIYNHFMNLDI